MNDKHNFAGYIKNLDNQYFCTVNDYVVKMFYREEQKEYDLKRDIDNAEKYLFGFDERDCPFAILTLKMEKDLFSNTPYKFSTPILIRGKQTTRDLSYFDCIEFYGETVNKVFNPHQAIEQPKLSCKVDDISLKFRPHSDFGLILTLADKKLKLSI